MLSSAQPVSPAFGACSLAGTLRSLVDHICHGDVTGSPNLVYCPPDRCAVHPSIRQTPTRIGSALSDGTNQGPVQFFSKSLVKTRQSAVGSAAVWDRSPKTPIFPGRAA